MLHKLNRIALQRKEYDALLSAVMLSHNTLSAKEFKELSKDFFTNYQRGEG